MTDVTARDDECSLRPTDVPGGTNDAALRRQWLSALSSEPGGLPVKRGNVPSSPGSKASRASKAAQPALLAAQAKRSSAVSEVSSVGNWKRFSPGNENRLLLPAAGFASETPPRRRGPRVYENIPTQASVVDQIVFGRDVDQSGESAFKQSFIGMFEGSAGQGSWEKASQETRMCSNDWLADLATGSASSSKPATAPSGRRVKHLGPRMYKSAPNQQSIVDQVIFGRDMDFSGEEQFDEEFTVMFDSMAGKPSWAPPQARCRRLVPGKSIMREGMQALEAPPRPSTGPSPHVHTRSPTSRHWRQQMQAMCSLSSGARSHRQQKAARASQGTPRLLGMVPEHEAAGSNTSWNWLR